MFIGHNAVGFASKSVARRPSLGLLMAAPMLLDLLWPIFLLLGIERVQPVAHAPNPLLALAFTHYPWSHSLLMSLLWGAALGGLYGWRTGDRRGAAVLAFGVVSHWVLDLVTHVPDLPLWPGGPQVGLGLWRWPAVAVALEALMYVAGIALYLRVTRPRDRIGRFSLAAFVLLLPTLYAVSFGPPPSPRAIAWGGLSGWLIPLWAGWFDRHRDAVR
jgi:hypothetical protein